MHSFTSWILNCMWLLPCTFLCVLTWLVRRGRFQRQREDAEGLAGDSRSLACGRSMSVAFFHPYCNAGGGGERVLWCAIRALQTRYDFVKCVVYTGDTEASPEQIISRAKERFNIELKREVHFVFLQRRAWVTAERYPVFTLLGQSLGSIVLGVEALWKFSPNVFVDSMGYAFVMPLFKYFNGSKTCSYVHYPTISTDMIMKVERREEDFNNASIISKSTVLSFGKLIYYRVFSWLYGAAGRCSDVVLVNSSWTNDHVATLWGVHPAIVYPPCDTKSLMELPLEKERGCKKIVSIAQFRPEKNHLLQLQSFKRFVDNCPRNMKDSYKLVMIGSCRDEGDESRLKSLKSEARKMKISKCVEFCANVSYEELVNHLMEATIGIHTMTDEHFGIGVVEFMAAGVIPLAHNSAGPKLDIVIDWEGEKTGFLASTASEYAYALSKIFGMPNEERIAMASNARACVKKRFSDETFKKRFLSETESLFK